MNHLVICGALVAAGCATDGDQQRQAGGVTSSSVVNDPETRSAPQEVPKQVPTIALTAMQENNDVLRVETNFESDESLSLRVEGKSYDSTAREGTTYTFRDVAVPKIGPNNAKLVVGGESIAFEINRTMTTIDEWRKYAKPLDFKVVDKNPDARTGALVKGRAQIYQIQEDEVDGEYYTAGGLNVTSSRYSWDDNVRFLMTGTSDFVEGDIVSYYGTIAGSYSYESQAGWNITTPMINVAFMTK